MFVPIGLWLKCPHCKHEVLAGDIFTKADMARLRPGIVTCPLCDARFTYGLTGFRIFAIGLCAFALMCVLLPFLQYKYSTEQINVVLGTIGLVILVILGGLQFAGLRLVE